MAHIPELMAAGVPARLARMLGSNRLRTYEAAGAAQGDATALFTNYCLIEAAEAGLGVRLGYASGAALNVLYALGPEAVLVYPAEGEAFNDQAADAPLRLEPGYSLLAVPSVSQWLAAVSAPDGGMSEAPEDGLPYARQDGEWLPVPAAVFVPPPTTNCSGAMVVEQAGVVFVANSTGAPLALQVMPGFSFLEIVDSIGDAGRNPITITVVGGATINGAASTTLGLPRAWVRLSWNGLDYTIVG